MSVSMLFVPGSAPAKFAKARASSAGALILDLEDSVASSEKDAARQHVVEMLRGAARAPEAMAKLDTAQTLWVRVNSAPSSLLEADLAAVVAERPFGIVLPKCCGRASLDPVAARLDALESAAGIPVGRTKILAIATETARSLFHFSEYPGSTPRLWGLTWGAEDLSADVGSLATRDEAGYTEPYRLARSLCLFGAAAAGVRAIDTVCVSLDDAALVQREAAEAFRDGFVGKMAVHPAQLAPIETGFTGTPEQLDWARRVIAAFESHPGEGAIRLDGKMIDEPHAKLARRLLGRSS